MDNFNLKSYSSSIIKKNYKYNARICGQMLQLNALIYKVNHLKVYRFGSKLTMIGGATKKAIDKIKSIEHNIHNWKANTQLKSKTTDFFLDVIFRNIFRRREMWFYFANNNKKFEYIFFLYFFLVFDKLSNSIKRMQN